MVIVVDQREVEAHVRRFPVGALSGMTKQKWFKAQK